MTNDVGWLIWQHNVVVQSSIAAIDRSLALLQEPVKSGLIPSRLPGGALGYSALASTSMTQALSHE